MRRAAFLAAILSTACVGSVDAPGAGSCVVCAGETPLLRVTRLEYETLVRGALGDEIADGLRIDYLPADANVGPFASNARSVIDESGVEAYRTLAESAGAAARGRASELLACPGATDEACIDAFVDRLGRALFRRELTGEDRAPYRDLFVETATTTTEADAVRMVVTAMLQSVHFLYHVEIGEPTADPLVVSLTDAEIAERLARFLWRGAPDDALLAAAREGRLGTRDEVMEEARRMLADPRADVSIGRFHTAWLGMDQLMSRTVDESPAFADLRDDMLAETRDFSVHVFREDPSIATLLTATYTVGSPELAAFYGASPPDADGLITLDGTRRAGIVTHAGFIASHTPSLDGAGVHRGKAIRTRFLCQNIPRPPPIDMVIPPDPGLSARQRLEQKTAGPSCTTCHRLMNPTGFLFEHYDRAGGWRDTDGAFAIDASGEVRDSDIEGELDGAVALAGALATSPDVERCLTMQWLRYALGREYVASEDGGSRTEAFAHYEDSGRDLRELVVAITGTDAFRRRRIPR